MTSMRDFAARVTTMTQPMPMNSRKTKPKKPKSWKKVTTRSPMAMANPENPSLKGSGAKESVMEFRLVPSRWVRSEEHTSELQSRGHLVCRLLLEKKKKQYKRSTGKHIR